MVRGHSAEETDEKGDIVFADVNIVTHDDIEIDLWIELFGGVKVYIYIYISPSKALIEGRENKRWNEDIS